MTSTATETKDRTGESTRETGPALHMVRTELDLDRLNHWMNTRGIRDQGHALHSLLVETFGDLAPHPFRAMTGERKRNQSLLGYTQADAGTLKKIIGTFTDPLQDGILIPGTLETKPMTRNWETGDRLGFDLLVRPIIRPSPRVEQDHPELMAAMRENGVRPDMEDDAFRWETIVQQVRGGPKPGREEVYAQWLAKRARSQQGCEIDPLDVILHDFRNTRASRKTGSAGPFGADAVLRGILTVTNPNDFNQLLAHGIGRHRAYGYGMILLKPPVKRTR